MSRQGPWGFQGPQMSPFQLKGFPPRRFRHDGQATLGRVPPQGGQNNPKTLRKDKQVKRVKPKREKKWQLEATTHINVFELRTSSLGRVLLFLLPGSGGKGQGGLM